MRKARTSTTHLSYSIQTFTSVICFLYIHSWDTLLRISRQHWVGPLTLETFPKDFGPYRPDGCRFFSYKSMWWISRFTTSQSCSTGLKSADKLSQFECSELVICQNIVCQKDTSVTPTTTRNVDLRQNGCMLSYCLCQVSPYCLNVAEEMNHQTREHFSNPLLFNFGGSKQFISSDTGCGLLLL